VASGQRRAFRGAQDNQAADARRKRLQRYHGPTINSWILAQNIPNAQLIVYPDAGHAAHFQYPELFLQHSRLFLDA
jgi:pimeloyl-ACP methyl ester carboxylesterase